jgi:hypothetical protein
LDVAARRPLDDAASIRTYHDSLLFLAAYPDDSLILRDIERELRRIARAARRLSCHRVRCLKNSGIAGTHIFCPYSLNICSWLARNFGRNAVLDWNDEDDEEAFCEFLNHIVAAVERDGLLSDRFSTRNWIRLATGRSRTDLAWLVQCFDALPASSALRGQAFEALDLPVRWSLLGRRASRTFLRFPRRTPYWQTHDIVRRPDVSAILKCRIPESRPLSLKPARKMLDICRGTMCVRRREIDTLTYANEREVYHFRLENGFDVAVFGMSPERRLPIESYFGFVVARNRVPIGYGGGWVFMERCEIGVNIFDEFRGGESALAFALVLRVFRWHFRAAYFTVDPFQFGADNAEAIRSGAFWFYYRLGFRPVDAKAAALAEEEVRRLSRDRAYRSPPSVLQRLAAARLRLELRSARDAGECVPEISDIGLAVTRWIGRRFDGDRSAAEHWAVQQALHSLKPVGRSDWSAEERAAFDRLCPLIAMTPWIARRPRADRQSLICLMRAKGGVTERAYVSRLQSNECLKRLLKEVAKAGARVGRSARP